MSHDNNFRLQLQLRTGFRQTSGLLLITDTQRVSFCGSRQVHTLTWTGSLQAQTWTSRWVSVITVLSKRRLRRIPVWRHRQAAAHYRRLRCRLLHPIE